MPAVIVKDNKVIANVNNGNPYFIQDSGLFETQSNKVNVINDQSTDNTYPSSKSVYNLLNQSLSVKSVRLNTLIGNNVYYLSDNDDKIFKDEKNTIIRITIGSGFGASNYYIRMNNMSGQYYTFYTFYPYGIKQIVYNSLSKTVEVMDEDNYQKEIDAVGILTRNNLGDIQALNFGSENQGKLLSVGSDGGVELVSLNTWNGGDY